MIIFLGLLFILFMTASVFSILSVHRDIPAYIFITKLSMAIILIVLLIGGFIIADRFINNFNYFHISLFFYLIIIFLTVLILYMAFSKWKNDFRSISAILVPITTILYTFSLFFYTSPRYMIVDPGHNFMIFHIILALLGEVLFFIGFASSILYIIVSWQLQKKSSLQYVNRLPSLTVLSNLTAFSLSRSLFFFSAGIIFGIIMVVQFYGTISFGTPKEILMYVAWGVLFILWILSKSHLTSNYYLSIITIVSFVVLLTVFIAGNVIITTGFHSFR
ncbi:MAG: cytochrome c biogenesis protein [Spirochaetes bacterium]|nr:cytochrome c biogenesis protein [Spirochaetota bacterium]